MQLLDTQLVTLHSLFAHPSISHNAGQYRIQVHWQLCCFPFESPLFVYRFCPSPGRSRLRCMLQSMSSLICFHNSMLLSFCSCFGSMLWFANTLHDTRCSVVSSCSSQWPQILLKHKSPLKFPYIGIIFSRVFRVFMASDPGIFRRYWQGSK